MKYFVDSSKSEGKNYLANKGPKHDFLVVQMGGIVPPEIVDKCKQMMIVRVNPAPITNNGRVVLSQGDLYGMGDKFGKDYWAIQYSLIPQGYLFSDTKGIKVNDTYFMRPAANGWYNLVFPDMFHSFFCAPTKEALDATLMNCLTLAEARIGKVKTNRKTKLAEIISSEIEKRNLLDSSLRKELHRQQIKTWGL